MPKAIFLTHKNALKSEVTGGVQLCSQEFRYIIEHIEGVELLDYYVPYSKNIMQRVQMKMGMENYSMYDVKKDTPALLAYIGNEDIEIVFINMASLVRYAKPIKQRFGSKVQVVMLSHGNHSGDFLHLITKPVNKTGAVRGFLQKLRLGLLIATEAIHRVHYLDSVIVLSETERQIENWFGGKKVVFMPRRLYAAFLEHKPVLGRVGFVGRLDHPPNLQGISLVLDELVGKNGDLDFRLVGAPIEYGKIIKEKYPFVNYLGELSDADLEKEVATWAFLLNPVWWYSTGASTKLAKAISWGVPIISSTAGMRGYEWKEGDLLVKDTPKDMATAILSNAFDTGQVEQWRNQTRTIANSGFSLDNLKKRFKSTMINGL
jgi:glycosyltransferase involved in cell wall biosynthesis